MNRAPPSRAPVPRRHLDWADLCNVGVAMASATPSRRVDVVFDGLFLYAALLRAEGVQRANVRQAAVRGFSLRMGQRATLVPDAKERSHGILMQLTQAEIEQLYSEPSVRAYRPEAVLAEAPDGTRVAALCFNLVAPPDPKETNREYAEKLRDLATRLGLPAAYVQSIR